jgi:hypothetical protein
MARVFDFDWTVRSLKMARILGARRGSHEAYEKVRRSENEERNDEVGPFSATDYREAYQS